MAQDPLWAPPNVLPASSTRWLRAVTGRPPKNKQPLPGIATLPVPLQTFPCGGDLGPGVGDSEDHQLHDARREKHILTHNLRGTGDNSGFHQRVRDWAWPRESEHGRQRCLASRTGPDSEGSNTSRWQGGLVRLPFNAGTPSSTL